MSSSPNSKSWKFCKFIAWFCPLFLGMACLGVPVLTEAENILAAIYVAAGLICMSLFCVSMLLIKLVELVSASNL